MFENVWFIVNISWYDKNIKKLSIKIVVRKYPTTILLKQSELNPIKNKSKQL